jgi:hypothetical protein
MFLTILSRKWPGPDLAPIHIHLAHVTGFRAGDVVQDRVNRDASGVTADRVIPRQPGRVDDRERDQHDDRRPAARPEKHHTEEQRRDEDPDRERVRKREQAKANTSGRQPDADTAAS